MTQKYLTLIILSLFLITSSTAQKLTHVQGEVLVEVKSDSDIAQLQRDFSTSKRYGSTVTSRQIMAKPMNIWVLKIDFAIDDENRFLEDILAHDKAILAQRNHISELRATIPDDPRFNQQWQYINTGSNGGIPDADLDIELAWDVATGGITPDGDTIVVCVIDEEFTNTHPDLSPNLWKNHAEIPGNGVDDDNNGYTDDVDGWNAYNNNGNVFSSSGHGSSVAGIVGAKGNNGEGVAGVNWDVKIMLVEGGGPESVALASYAYPYEMRKRYNETNGEEGAFVVSTNASWGVDFGMADDAPIWCEFYNRLGEIGILNFGATINSNVNVDEAGDLPTTCDSEYLVSVTNMNRSDNKVGGAGFGRKHIDLGAFGREAYTISGSSYGGFGGTSGATPHVAGTAALLYSAQCSDFHTLVRSNPSQAALIIKDCILNGVDSNGSLDGITTTGGRLNVNNAINNLVDYCESCTDAVGINMTDLTDKSTTFQWAEADSEGDVSLRYRSVGSTNWNVVSDINSPYDLDGLTACVEYEYEVKTDCPGNSGPYRYTRNFMTDGCCDIPIIASTQVIDGIITIEWEEVLAATSYVVEYREIGETNWLSTTTDAQNTFEIPNLPNCTFLEARIKSQCAATDNESVYTEIFFISSDCGACTKDYCQFGEKNTSDEYIESVEISGVFSNVSGRSDEGYENFLGSFDIPLNQDEEYTITLTPEHTGTIYPEFFTAAIDFNQDGQFSDSEIIYQDNEATEIAVSGTFVVPLDAAPGITRMRIIMRYQEVNGVCDENGFEFGEVEDYCVEILPANVDCPEEYNAAVVDSTLTGITFFLPEDDRVSSYILEYREEGQSNFTSIIQPSEIFSINGLTKCTEYEYRSAIICAGSQRPYTSIAKTSTACDTGIEDSELQSVVIFPNPSNGILNIDNKNIVIDRIEIYSLTGEVLLSTTTTQNSIDCSNWSSGMYLVKLINGQESSIKKWILK